MTSGTIELVERVRQRLQRQDNPVRIAGPAPEDAISAAEEALGCTFPPSYRLFLRTFGGITLPTHLGIVHDFVGVAPGAAAARPAPAPDGTIDDAVDDAIDDAVDGTIDDTGDGAPEGTIDGALAGATAETGDDDAGEADVVRRTLRARAERRLGEHLVVVGMGAQYQEWFCLDVSRPLPNGEYPVLLYDARDNALDQQFYDDFGQMLEEVMGFVADSLDQPLD